jgi:small subunit ribosomal protein S4
MSRYTGPRVKRMRRLGLELPGLSRKSIGKRGARAAPRRKSDFGRQLTEKQKLRMNYGLTERQLRDVVVEARRSKTATGPKIVELLERRLDNVVFRAGLAPTIPAARQLVRHKHVLVNGRPVTMPALRVRTGDVVALRESRRDHPAVLDALQNPPLERPEWLSFDEDKRSAAVRHLPVEGEAPFPVELPLVVEYYATRL